MDWPLAFVSVGVSGFISTFFMLTIFFISDCQYKLIKSNDKVKIQQLEVEKIKEENRVFFQSDIQNNIGNYKIVPREDYLK